MGRTATVFDIMIASPGDVEIQRAIAREVIHAWNASHSRSRGIILQAVGWETHSRPSMEDRPQSIINKQILKDADLLVAIFWTRLGTPTGEAASGTVEEIEEHLKTGKPAMIYFSDAPVRLDSVDDAQYAALRAFREDMKKRGLVETFGSPEEFREKFARHLAGTINEHAHFKAAGGSAERPPERWLIPDVVPAITEQPLSREAMELLLAAVKDNHGTILLSRHMGGTDVQTNRKNFVERGSPRSAAIWEAALEELRDTGHIKDLGRGEVFQVTRKGYDLAELLKEAS